MTTNAELWDSLFRTAELLDKANLPKPAADALRDSVTFLTWDQLSAAITASYDEYENRFAAFTNAARAAADAAHNGSPMLAELRAEMDGCWAACKAQDVMTHALTDERAARRDRADYA